MHHADDIYWLIVVAVAGIVVFMAVLMPLTEWYRRRQVDREAKLRDEAYHRR